MTKNTNRKLVLVWFIWGVVLSNCLWAGNNTQLTYAAPVQAGMTTTYTITSKVNQTSQYYFYWGDGGQTQSNSGQESHVYQSAGSYQVTAWVYNGTWYNDVYEVVVQNPSSGGTRTDYGQQTSITYSNQLTAGISSVFNMSLLPAGNIQNTYVYWGDASSADGYQSGPNLTHTYATSGTYQLTLYLLENGAWKHDVYSIVVGQGTGGGQRQHSYGVNIGWPDRASRNSNVINEVNNLGTKIIRFDLRNRDGYGNTLSPSHYANLMDDFAAQGVDVLVTFTGASWDGSAHDHQHALSQSNYVICDHYYPTSWGQSNVMPYIYAIMPYVEAIKNKSNLLGVELWNEANLIGDAYHNYTNGTHMCPADYAYLLTEAKLTWPNINIASSTVEANKGTYSRDYLYRMLHNTDKINYYKYWRPGATGASPVDVLAHHPYGSHYGSKEGIRDYIQFQYDSLQSIQIPGHEVPVWFTEFGWQAGNNPTAQKNMIKWAIESIDEQASLSPEKVFQYSLWDCNAGNESFGLIAGFDNCVHATSTQKRPAWYAFRDFINGQ